MDGGAEELNSHNDIHTFTMAIQISDSSAINLRNDPYGFDAPFFLINNSDAAATVGFGFEATFLNQIPT